MSTATVNMQVGPPISSRSAFNSSERTSPDFARKFASKSRTLPVFCMRCRKSSRSDARAHNPSSSVERPITSSRVKPDRLRKAGLTSMSLPSATRAIVINAGLA
jgi:hypothetical protein